jgi:hypothetical protein
MSNATLEKLIWTLIYGGLLAGSLGLFVVPGDATLGALLGFGGLAAAGLGAVLIWVRSLLEPKDSR